MMLSTTTTDVGLKFYLNFEHHFNKSFGLRGVHPATTLQSARPWGKSIMTFMEITSHYDAKLPVSYTAN